MDIQDSTIELEQDLYTPPSFVRDIIRQQKCPFRTITTVSGRVEMMPCDVHCMALLWTADQSTPMIQCKRLVKGNLELNDWFD